MTETLSIRIDSGTKQNVEVEEWQLGEIHAGIADLDERHEVSRKRVVKWLASWGNPDETKPLR